MSRIDGYCSLMGQGREALRGVDAFGCLRSLRARSALDGVSWVQGGSVEIAAGHGLTACYKDQRRRLLPPSGVAPLGSWIRPPVSWIVGLGQYELRLISQHRMHDDLESARQSDSRFAHR